MNIKKLLEKYTFKQINNLISTRQLPGLYWYKKFYDFEELVEKKIIAVNNNKLTYCDKNITGFLVIPDYILEIGFRAFSSCKIYGITLPKNLTVINRNVFEYSLIQEIILPEKVERIKQDAFLNSSLKKIDLKNVRIIEQNAFKNCEKLSNVEMSKRLYYVGKSSFSNCTSLKNLKLPESLYVIEDYAFAYCKNLNKIKIPKAIEVIGSNAFKNVDTIILENNNFIDLGAKNIINIINNQDYPYST